MEEKKLSLLKFDIIIKIMPYYGQTHKAFLLLSRLCIRSRQELDKNYNEFIINMNKYWQWIEFNEQKVFKHILLPNDLFGVKFWCTSELGFNAFIEFIKNLEDCKGWYFNKHYMHLNIKTEVPIQISEFINEAIHNLNNKKTLVINNIS